MLEVQEIHTYYGDSHALQGVSLQVREGSIVAVLGRNGVGKTTLIRSIMGLTPPRKGKILFREMDITALPCHRRARLGMSLVPQGRQIFSSLTALENLTVAERDANAKKAAAWNIGRVLALFPQLRLRLLHRADKLSGGEQQMLASGRALVSNPHFLLMDEPTEGLAPLLRREVLRGLRQLKEENVSVLLVEQNLPFALQVADHIYVMSKGTIVHESAPGELRDNEEVKRHYLGL